MMPYTKINVDIAAVILDDDQDLLELIERKLQGHKLFNYKLFYDTKLFLESLTDDIRVVVIDHRLMSHLDGLEIVKAVKKKNKENFVIGYSYIRDPKILIQYINSDIDRFIDKDEVGHIERLIDCIKDGMVEAERRTSFYNYLKDKMKKLS